MSQGFPTARRRPPGALKDAHRGRLLVRNFTRESEHGEPSSLEYAAATRSPAAWVRTGHKPAPATVAARPPARRSTPGCVPRRYASRVYPRPGAGTGRRCPPRGSAPGTVWTAWASRPEPTPSRPQCGLPPAVTPFRKAPAESCRKFLQGPSVLAVTAVTFLFGPVRPAGGPPLNGGSHAPGRPDRSPPRRRRAQDRRSHPAAPRPGQVQGPPQHPHAARVRPAGPAVGNALRNAVRRRAPGPSSRGRPAPSGRRTPSAAPGCRRSPPAACSRRPRPSPRPAGGPSSAAGR